MLLKTLTLLHSHTYATMSLLETIQGDIMALLLQLQTSHSALDQYNGRLVAENNTMSAVLHSQASHITELQKTIQAQQIEIEFYQRQAPKVPLAQRQKL